MEKEANILKYGLATKPLLVRIDRSAYAPQMRRIADLQSWLVGPGVLYIPAYREGGSKCQPPTLYRHRTCFCYSTPSRNSNGCEFDVESRNTLGRQTIFVRETGRLQSVIRLAGLITGPRYDITVAS